VSRDPWHAPEASADEFYAEMEEREREGKCPVDRCECAALWECHYCGGLYCLDHRSPGAHSAECKRLADLEDAQDAADERLKECF
jgi:hypothetical protein